MLRARMALAAALAAAVLLTPARPAAFAQVDDAWTPYQAEAGDVALAVPPDWVVLDLRSPMLEEQLQQIEAQSPILAASVRASLPAYQANGTLLTAYAMRSGAASHAHALMALAVLPAALGRATFDFLVDVNVQSLARERQVVPPIDHERVALPQGAAERITFGRRMAVARGGDPLELATIQYLLLQDGWTVYLTCLGDVEEEPVVAEACDGAAMNLRLTLAPRAS